MVGYILFDTVLCFYVWWFQGDGCDDGEEETGLNWLIILTKW